MSRFARVVGLVIRAEAALLRPPRGSGQVALGQQQPRPLRRGRVEKAPMPLHDAADIGEDLWHRLAGLFSQEQLLDLLMLAGWYHAISFTANGARVAREDGAPRFADVTSADT